MWASTGEEIEDLTKPPVRTGRPGSFAAGSPNRARCRRVADYRATPISMDRRAGSPSSAAEADS